MGTLFQTIQKDLEGALRARTEDVLSVLRMLKSDLQYEMTKTGVKDLPDADVQAAIQRSIKKRKDSVEQFNAVGRKDMAEKESAEIVILEKYLPAKVSDADINAAVEEAVKAMNPGAGDVGKVMGRVMGKFKGQNIDGTRVKELVQKRIGG